MHPAGVVATAAAAAAAAAALLALVHCMFCCVVLCYYCSGWNGPSAQAQLERTLQVICKELEADGVSNHLCLYFMHASFG
jgi:hypothetical protein